MEKYYALNEVAMMTGLTTRTLRNYLKMEVLKGEKVEGVWKFTEEEFAEFIQNRYVKPSLKVSTPAYNAKEEQAAKKERRKPELLLHFSCHNLRHTFCIRFCENETNLKIIHEIMGHADISTTMDIYNKATKEKKLKI